MGSGRLGGGAKFKAGFRACLTQGGRKLTLDLILTLQSCFMASWSPWKSACRTGQSDQPAFRWQENPCERYMLKRVRACL